MKKHEVNLNDLKEWMLTAEYEFAGAYGKGEHKSLKCTLNGTFNVYSQRELILSTHEAGLAVKTYNEI